MAPDSRASGDTEPPSPSRFPPSDRLRRRPEFLRVQRKGRRVHTPHFVVAIMLTPEGGSALRIGITVTRKVAGSVGRNRTKRVVREVFRRNRLLFPEGCDVVLIAKSGAHLLGYEQVRAELATVRRAMSQAARKARRAASRPEQNEAR